MVIGSTSINLSNIHVKFAVNIWAVNWVWFMTSVLLWQISEKMQANGWTKYLFWLRVSEDSAHQAGKGMLQGQLHLIMQETQSLYPSLLPFLPIYFPSLCSFCEMVLSTFMKGLLLVNGVWKLSLGPQKYAWLIFLELLSLINLTIKNYHSLSLMFFLCSPNGLCMRNYFLISFCIVKENLDLLSCWVNL